MLQAPVELLLSRLRGIREHGPGRYFARCPAHDDGRASLSIRALEDGRVLVHDFAGCSVGEVLDALGLTVGDLFPDRPRAHRAGPDRRAHALAPRDALAVIGGDATLIAVLARGEAAPKIAEAAGRILAALELAGVAPEVRPAQENGHAR